MNTKKRLEPQTRSVLSRQKSDDRQELFKTLPRFAGIVTALLIAVCASNAAELPRHGEAIDAGDSYGLRDDSRVVLHRLLNEVFIETWGRSPTKTKVNTPLYASGACANYRSSPRGVYGRILAVLFRRSFGDGRLGCRTPCLVIHRQRRIHGPDPGSRS